MQRGLLLPNDDHLQLCRKMSHTGVRRDQIVGNDVAELSDLCGERVFVLLGCGAS